METERVAAMNRIDNLLQTIAQFLSVGMRLARLVSGGAGVTANTLAFKDRPTYGK